MGLINYQDINFEAKYEGYLWLSNEKKPIVYHNEQVDKALFNNKNPFIIEGQLYDYDSMISYSLKYVDGELKIYQFQVKSEDFNNEDIDIQTYMPNRVEGVSGLKFLQYWRPKEDKLCENGINEKGMEVLQPCEIVFVGFETKKEEEDKK